MWNWFKRLIQPEPLPLPVNSPDDRIVSLEADARQLRLELDEQVQLVATLTRTLEQQRAQGDRRVSDATQDAVHDLVRQLAGPVSQFATQMYLLETEGKPILAKDVLTVARRLIRALEDYGVTLEGAVGESRVFDPDRHEPLGEDNPLSPGETGVIRFAGVCHQGRIIRKASMERKKGS